MSQEGQIADRFTKATDQLGADEPASGKEPARHKVEVRMGGIYSLQEIANSSEEYYGPVIQVFTAYVRQNASSLFGMGCIRGERMYRRGRLVALRAFGAVGKWES